MQKNPHVTWGFYNMSKVILKVNNPLYPRLFICYKSTALKETAKQVTKRSERTAKQQPDTTELKKGKLAMVKIRLGPLSNYFSVLTCIHSPSSHLAFFHICEMNTLLPNPNK